MNFCLEERINWISAEYRQYDNTVSVEEKVEEGKAKVVFTAETKLLSISVSHRNRLNYLRQQKVADGTICKFSDNSIELHIVECKKTIKPASWFKAKEQFEGALLNSIALNGLLNLNISKIIFKSQTFSCRKSVMDISIFIYILFPASKHEKG